MREILFRGKRDDNGEWVYGYYLVDTQVLDDKGIEQAFILKLNYHPCGCSLVGSPPVIHETVGQYTGLTDKNGKKIFEGDIVDILTENEELGEITYEDGGFWIEADGFSLTFTENLNGNNVRVIGNIHDTPELIKREAEE